MTRKIIGATFEGETKDADGGMWAECELEGDVLSTDVRIRLTLRIRFRD